MASVNRVIIVGNLGKDPETRYAPSGDAVTNIVVATTETWKDKTSGEKREATEWHRVVFFGKLAEIAGQYLKKGSQVYLEGKLKTRKWQDKDGQDRFTTEINADEMKMLGSKGDGQQQEGQRLQQDKPRDSRFGNTINTPKQQQGPAGGFSDMDDDIPFRQIGSGASWRVI